MDKKLNDKPIKAQSELICRPDRRCCSYGSTCPAEYKITPKGDMVFNRCDCY
ncbi:hypothetical protein JTE87_04137 [Bacillus amyloliquefaciens]|nr:hypothetical protein [Bacillus subtilis]MCB5337133.1 hypothetical protein [Bacillus amyloliquefaciens]